MNKVKSEVSAIQRMVIEESILIHAKIDKVWKTFTDLTCWKQWNTVMEDVCTREKCLSCGEEFSCCFRPLVLPIKATIRIEEAKPYERIVWSAQKKGFTARNIFTFQNNEKGVIVTSRDTFSGFIIRVFGFLLPKKRMRTLIQIFLKDLKTASENQNEK
jgi:hypothetical protein